VQSDRALHRRVLQLAERVEAARLRAFALVVAQLLSPRAAAARIRSAALSTALRSPMISTSARCRGTCLERVHNEAGGVGST
jgi:hypothetical protein